MASPADFLGWASKHSMLGPLRSWLENASPQSGSPKPGTFHMHHFLEKDHAPLGDPLALLLRAAIYPNRGDDDAVLAGGRARRAAFMGSKGAVLADPPAPPR